MHDIIDREIDLLSTLGDVAIIGNMYSRVGSIQEKHYGIDTDSRSDDLSRVEIVPPWNTHGIRVSTHDRKRLQLMTNYDMTLVNIPVVRGMAVQWSICS